KRPAGARRRLPGPPTAASSTTATPPRDQITEPSSPPRNTARIGARCLGPAKPVDLALAIVGQGARAVAVTVTAYYLKRELLREGPLVAEVAPILTMRQVRGSGRRPVKPFPAPACTTGHGQRILSACQDFP